MANSIHASITAIMPPSGKRLLTRRAVAIACLGLVLLSCTSLSGSGDTFIALESNKFT